MASKFGSENAIAEVLKDSVWRGVSKTVEGRQAVVNDAFEDLTIKEGPKVRLKVTGGLPGAAPRHTTPAVTSFLADYRLVTPGIPGTCQITPTPSAPAIAAPAVDQPGEGIHFVRGIEERTACNIGRGLVTYVDDATKAGCALCRVAAGLELHMHQGMPLPSALTFGASQPLVRVGDEAMKHVDWSTPARSSFAVSPAAVLEGLRTVAPDYDGNPQRKIRPMTIIFVGDGNNLDAAQMRHLVEHTKLPIPVTFGRLTIGSVVALEFTATGPVHNVTADLEMIGQWQQAPLRNKSLGIINNDPLKPRLYALQIPTTETSAITSALDNAAPVSPSVAQAAPIALTSAAVTAPSNNDDAIIAALGLPEAEATMLRTLAAGASAGWADYGVTLTLEQYLRGLLRAEARRCGLVTKPNGAPVLRALPASQPFPGPHTPTA